MLRSCPDAANHWANHWGGGAPSAATAPLRAQGIEARLLQVPSAGFPMWLVDVPRSRPGHVEGLLSAAERVRAQRYKIEALRDRYTVAHGSLRIILRDCYGASLNKQELSENEFGKPFLPLAPHLHFSVSYSAGYALIGVSEDGEIGVDIEAMRIIADTGDLAELHYTARERAEIQTDRPSEVERSRRFLSIWVKKEACVKASGYGLGIPLNQVECGGTDQARIVRLPDGQRYRTGIVKIRGDPIVGWARNLV